jgi:hypothetical protein
MYLHAYSSLSYFKYGTDACTVPKVGQVSKCFNGTFSSTSTTELGPFHPVEPGLEILKTHLVRLRFEPAEVSCTESLFTF